MKFLTLSLFALTIPAHAVTLKVFPASPQPGDVLTVTIYPHAGETIEGVGMNAYDTQNVPFFKRPDGLARAFVGLPFDRSGGKTTLSARVQTNGGEKIVSTVVNAKARYFPTQRIKMNNSNAGKMDMKAKLRAEKAHVQAKMRETYGAPLWSGSWLVPTKGSPSSAYGRKRYVNGKWWGQHNGSDIRASSGAPTLATNAGRVVLSEYLPTLRGNCVVIDHGCNVFSTYMHMSKREVSEGDTVARGQRIGLVGATGFVTGAHLHWEMRVGWEPVDPYQFVRGGLKF